MARPDGRGDLTETAIDQSVRSDLGNELVDELDTNVGHVTKLALDAYCTKWYNDGLSKSIGTRAFRRVGHP